MFERLYQYDTGAK